MFLPWTWAALTGAAHFSYGRLVLCPTQTATNRLLLPHVNRPNGLLRLTAGKVGGTDVDQPRNVIESRITDLWTWPDVHASASRNVLLGVSVIAHLVLRPSQPSLYPSLVIQHSHILPEGHKASRTDRLARGNFIKLPSLAPAILRWPL